jgi:hypothetical protein
MHFICRLREDNAKMFALEMQPERRRQLEHTGVQACPTQSKDDFLREPMDALVVNASGGSLCSDSVRTSSDNERLKVVCGSENLVMPNPADADIYRAHHKAYCPTELGGMMGYLTAVEEYLAHLDGSAFDANTIMTAARELEEPAFRATTYMRKHDFGVGFEEAVEATCA